MCVCVCVQLANGSKGQLNQRHTESHGCLATKWRCNCRPFLINEKHKESNKERGRERRGEGGEREREGESAQQLGTVCNWGVCARVCVPVCGPQSTWNCGWTSINNVTVIASRTHPHTHTYAFLSAKFCNYVSSHSWRKQLSLKCLFLVWLRWKRFSGHFWQGNEHSINMLTSIY